MRRHNVVSGVLFILPIINFALAAPALVQEKRHAFVDVVHRPDDVITVLGKRVGLEDPLDSMWDKYFQKLWGKPEVSSATHAPSSPAPSSPGHESTNVIQEPAPNPASSTANSGHALVEPTGPSSAVSPMPEVEGIEHAESGDHSQAPPPTPASSEDGLDHHEITEITEVHSPQSSPKPKPIPSTNSNPDMDWDYWQNKEDTPPRPGSSTKSGAGWKYWMNPLNIMSPMTPEATLSTLSKSKPSTKSDFNWDYWHNLDDIPPQSGASSKLSNTKPSTSSSSGLNSFLKKWKNPLANLKPSKSGQSNPGPSNPGQSNPGQSNPGTRSTKFAPKIPPSNTATQLSSADLPGADSQPLA
jgi:hypothetical protein